MIELRLPHVDDFDITGDGSAAAWNKADWQTLDCIDEGVQSYPTRAKVLWSDKGVYFLLDCEDRKLACTMTDDQGDLWTEDVVEVFLQPDAEVPTYLEYELSPLNVELTLGINNTGGTFYGWSPWHYEGDRLVRRATSVRGGEKASMASVDGWVAEFFIPFALMRGMIKQAPAAGDRWRANIYRIDYDNDPAVHWAWSPGVKGFHNYQKFGTFVFE